MIDSYTVSCTVGKKRTSSGTITVNLPDDYDDVLLTARGECGDERSMFIRPEEARLLARILLQVTETE